MHRIISLLLILTACVVNARQVSPDEAQTIAAEFFSSGSSSIKKAPRRIVRVEHSSSNDQLEPQPYYIFNASDNAGFVIVSGDTRAKEIIGYSDKGSINADKIPPQLAWLLSEYQKALKSLPADAKAPRRQTSVSANQEPLLSTQWGQSAPFNDKCPQIDGSRSLTGCVATAMAQVINYEKKSNIVKTIPGYGTLSALPEYKFDFNGLDNDGIATLMLYCGQSVKTSYGIQESGAYAEDIPSALSNYFGWEPEVRLIERANYNNTHWNRMVTEEIAAGHPIIYSAVSEAGVGHAFVVDGVSDDYFHVNWGWAGNSDGYFSFSPFSSVDKSEYVLMQRMVTTRDDEPSADLITYGTTINCINYQLNDDLTATVLPLKNGEKYSGELRIPSTVNYKGKTYTVSYFGQNAFVKCENLTSIFIPATIKSQEWSIFDGCINLHKVDVEDLAAFIKIEVGGWWTGSPFMYGADLYLNGELVKNLVIPDGIEKIGYCKFDHCTSIETVTIPSSMKVAGQYSFSWCPKLRAIYFKDQSSLELIDILAFVNDESLEEIYLPASLKTIREDCFGDINGPGCKKLRKIVSLATTPPWSEHNASFRELHFSDAIVYVPEESIEAYRNAKEWCNFIDIRPLSEEQPLPQTKAVLNGEIVYELNLDEKNAKLIGVRDHYYENLTTISIPNAINYKNETYPVESAGFAALRNVRISNIEARLNKIGIGSFAWASFESDTLKIPNTITRITRCAFTDSEIKNLVLPESIKKIDIDAFSRIDTERHISSIESLSPEPPVISEASFDKLTYETTPLRVPFGCRKAYARAEGWRNFKNISNIGDKQEQVHDNDLTLSAQLQGNTFVRNKMSLSFKATAYNSGTQKAAGFDMSWSIDGTNVDKKHFDIEIDPNESYSFAEKVTVNVDAAGKHELKLHITIYGAEDQDNSDNVVNLSFESFERNYYRVSLIEQFTSEACGLTPNFSSKVISGIQNSGYSDFVTHVVNHCGFYDDFLTMNRDYEWFYNDYGTYTPAMMINRSDIKGSGYTPVKEISDAVDREIINEAGFCDAMISVDCDVVDNKVYVKTLLEKNADFDLTSGYDYLTVFLIEDSIPAQNQYDVWSDSYLTDYIHRNTLRKVLSKTWGNKIVWEGDICAWKFESDLDPSWNTDNLKAVAFIHRYDPQSPINCQVYTANSSDLPQYGMELDESVYEDPYFNSIYNIQQPSETFDIYNIVGIKVRSKVTNFEGLPSGIYICNGQKIYIK